MSIERFQKNPRMSMAVKHAGSLHISGQVPDDFEASIEEQTRQVLAKIDALLTEAGSDRSRLVSINVYLPMIMDFDAMNSIYDAWIDPENQPARACVEARLAHPSLRVEMSAIAAVE
ncbi:RidA family protein [Parasedimentitalea psychrophila]|uniref:RidA family protein n=1 Tax=Parasedimentitalea psychrophila TaxID=2997337 RepID=A0A9Y2KY09_9RHOB|nr:RidA family protein [Parasedimentitalea psychrophila]WIY24763.1 RidA family protein [Parasedimentitalea psychrophila]